MLMTTGSMPRRTVVVCGSAPLVSTRITGSATERLHVFSRTSGGVLPVVIPVEAERRVRVVAGGQDARRLGNRGPGEAQARDRGDLDGDLLAIGQVDVLDWSEAVVLGRGLVGLVVPVDRVGLDGDV